jgi:3'-5' exoribonuclease
MTAQSAFPAGVSTTTAGLDLPYHFRLVSTIRLPAQKGRGVFNEAALYHAGASLRVSWHSAQVDIRLKRGCYVTIRGEHSKGLDDDGCLPIARLDILDKPLASINPFEMVPPSWAGGDLAWRATLLWDQLSRPFRHLLNAVFWDAGRFYRFVTGPASHADDRRYPNGNFRHAVETAEHVANLSRGLHDVSHSVLIAAALLHDAGKADDFRLSPEGEGYVLSERGLWVGYQQTILEWLAVARSRVIVPDAQYLALVHALIAARGTTAIGGSESKSIEAMMLSVADRMAGQAHSALFVQGA